MTEHPQITRVSVYPDIEGKYRFTAYATNGKAIVVSSESYENHLDARGAAVALFPDAALDDQMN